MTDDYRNNTGSRKGREAAILPIERYMNNCLGPDYDGILRKIESRLSRENSNQDKEYTR